MFTHMTLKTTSGVWKTSNLLLTNGAVQQSQTVTVNEHSSLESYSNPNWKRLVATGQEATTPFIATRQVVNPINPCWFKSRRRRLIDGFIGGSEYSGFPNFGYSGNIAPLDASYFNTLDNQLVGRFAKKLLDAQRTLDGAVVLGELRETLSMVARPGKALREGLQRYLKLAEKRARKTARHPFYRRSGRDSRRRILTDVVTGTWLEGAFGWAPLLGDIDSGMEALADLQYRTYPPRRTVSSFLPFNFERNKQEFLAFNTNRDGILKFNSTELVEGFVKLRGCVVLKNAGEPSWTQTLGLTAKSFVPTLWELLPWSFLVDYFTNVGDILLAYSYGNMKCAWGVYTRKYRISVLQDYRYDLIRDPEWVYDPVSLILPNVRIGYEYTLRSARNGPYVPELQFSLPTSWKQWTNIAALYGQHNSARDRIGGLIEKGAIDHNNHQRA
jgi:hypothetical protein